MPENRYNIRIFLKYIGENDDNPEKPDKIVRNIKKPGTFFPAGIKPECGAEPE